MLEKDKMIITIETLRENQTYKTTHEINDFAITWHELLIAFLHMLQICGYNIEKDKVKIEDEYWVDFIPEKIT